MAAGAVVACVLALTGWRSVGTPALPWALLAGSLVAFTIGGRPPPD